MSRGPGEIERRVRDLLNDPARNEWTLQRLTREVCGSAWNKPTDAQRSSVARAVRRVMAGAPGGWRVSMARTHWTTKTLIRDRPIAANNDHVPIWAYRFTQSGVVWESAVIERRTRTRRYVRVGGIQVVTDAHLNPIESADPLQRRIDRKLKPQWKFEPVRSPQVEAMVDEFWRIDWGADGRGGASSTSPDALLQALSMLGLQHPYTPQDVRRAYRERAMKLHSGLGADHAFQAALNLARDAALAMAVDDGAEDPADQDDDAAWDDDEPLPIG